MRLAIKILLSILLTSMLCFAQSKTSGASGSGTAQASGFTSEVFTRSIQLDIYGGRIDQTCTNTVGYFILTKNAKNQWRFCDALGHPMFEISVGNLVPNSNPTLDCNSDNTYPIYGQKYGDATFNWALQTLKRITAWGFNAVGQDRSLFVAWNETCTSCVWPGLTQPVPLPYNFEDKPYQNCSVNVSNFVSEPCKDVMNGINANYTAFRSLVPDTFDPKLGPYETAAITNGTGLGNADVKGNSPWLMHIFMDDSDFFTGSGCGPDFHCGGKQAPNLGFLNLIASPVQTYVQSTRYQGKKFTYADTVVHVKADATNPVHGTCSISNPCSLRDFLYDEYSGSITALNTAWGSNYTTFDSTGTQVTGEAVGTGDGVTLTFTHTLAHTPVDPLSMAFLVAGVVKGGDCPWFHPSASCSTTTTNTGTFGSPTANYITQATSTINYSTGAITIVFVAAPANGAAITVNYIYGGWMAGGTGLMDESGGTGSQAGCPGSGTSTCWVGTNPYCEEGADVNFPNYFSCVGGGGINQPVPNATLAVGQDIDNWESEDSAKYFKTIQGVVRSFSKILFFGLDTTGAWAGTAYSKFIQGEAPYVDGIFTSFRADFQTPAEAAAQYQYITKYLGDKPFGLFIVPNAQPDSAMSCFATGGSPLIVPTQDIRGQGWYNTMNYLLSTPSFNGTYPFVEFDWWTFIDFQSLNQGLVSVHDNDYDGKRASRAVYVDPLTGVTSTPDLADYGNVIQWVIKANQLWLLK